MKKKNKADMIAWSTQATGLEYEAIWREVDRALSLHAIMHAYQQGEMDATYLRCKIYEGGIFVNITVRDG